MSHTMRLVKGAGITWNYSCSCKRVKKDGLKGRGSAEIIHAAHVRSMNAAKLAQK
jgi:hypothetical protein